MYSSSMTAIREEHEMANLLTTPRTYKTFANAEKALAAKFEDLSGVRYLIAATPDGRFAPVLVGNQYIPYAVMGHFMVVS